MAALAPAVFVLVLGVLPLGMGNALVRGKSLPLTFVGGLFAGFALFWGLTLVFNLTMGSLRLMTALWLALCTGLAVWGALRWRRGQHPVPRPRPARTPAQRLLLAAVLGLIALHILNTVFNTMYNNWDDETYVTLAASSVLSDTVARVNPYTGHPVRALFDPQYALSLWPLYSATLSVLTGLHPAIVFRTVLPVFVLVFGYFVIWLLLGSFWGGADDKVLPSMFFFLVFTAVTAEHLDHISAEWWFTAVAWFGKSLAGAVLAPLVLWLLIQLDGEGPHAADRGAVWRALLAVCWGGCLFAATVFYILPVELAVWGALYLLRTRRWRESVNLLVCGLPAAACAVFLYIILP